MWVRCALPETRQKLPGVCQSTDSDSIKNFPCLSRQKETTSLEESTEWIHQEGQPPTCFLRTLDLVSLHPSGFQCNPFMIHRSTPLLTFTETLKTGRLQIIISKIINQVTHVHCPLSPCKVAQIGIPATAGGIDRLEH